MYASTMVSCGCQLSTDSEGGSLPDSIKDDDLEKYNSPTKKKYKTPIYICQFGFLSSKCWP